MPDATRRAVHNIPEGLAVAMPIYYATQRRALAVGLGALSGMSEPFGALLASLVANEHADSGVFGGMFGLTGGMMHAMDGWWDATFTDSPEVANGYSDLLTAALGTERGAHARSAVCVSGLPGGAAVEIEAVVELVDPSKVSAA